MGIRNKIEPTPFSSRRRLTFEMTKQVDCANLQSIDKAFFVGGIFFSTPKAQGERNITG